MSQRFASPFKFSIQVSILFPSYFASWFLTLTTICQIARRWLVDDREYNDTPWLPFLFRSRNRSTTATVYQRKYGTLYRCRWIEFDAFRSLYFHTVFRPLLFIYQCCHCCYNCSLTSFSQFLIHALGVSRKMKRILCSVRVDRT